MTSSPSKVTIVHHQGDGLFNEDNYVNCHPLYAVIDGASSLYDVQYPDEQGNLVTGGKRASTLVKAVLEGYTSPTKSLTTLFGLANALLQNKMRAAEVDLSDKAARWGAAAAAVKLNEDSFSYARIGDCMIMALYGEGEHLLVTPYADHDAREIRVWATMEGSRKEKWNERLPDIIETRQKANRDYGMLNGEPEAERFLETGTVSLDGLTDLLLFTDGLFLPHNDVHKPPRWEGMANVYRLGGLGDLQLYVRGVESKDPHCSTYPRFKQHDDITGIALRFA